METTQTMGRARWTRVAVLGLILLAAGPLLQLVAGTIFGLEMGEVVAFFLIPAVVVLGAAFLSWKLGLAGKIIGLVVAILALLPMWWMVFGLTVPGSFFEFTAGLLFLTGFVSALVGSIRAIGAQRRGQLSAAAEGGERTWIRTVLTGVAVLALLSALLTFAGRETVDAEAAGAATTVTMKSFEFDKNFDENEGPYTVAGGQKVLVRNDDPFIHTFTVDALQIDETFGPASSKVITVPSRPGTYVLYCKPHGDPQNPEENDMNATLVIT